MKNNEQEHSDVKVNIYKLIAENIRATDRH